LISGLIVEFRNWPEELPSFEIDQAVMTCHGHDGFWSIFVTNNVRHKQQVPDVERFMNEYHMQCPMAATRLLHSGLPATIEHKTKQRSSDPESASVAETVQHFITAMDALKLRMVAVDQLCPILSDLITAMSKVSSLPQDFVPKVRLENGEYNVDESNCSPLSDQSTRGLSAFV